MVTILIAYFFALGIIIGSFLNVVILRHNTGKTLKGRSMCMSCKTSLKGKDLVPVLSFLIQKGKCRYCQSKISLQYAAVELATGILFAANFYMHVLIASSVLELTLSLLFTTILLALYVVIFVYDLKHKIIPNVFSFAAFGCAVLYGLISYLLFESNPFWFGGDAMTWVPFLIMNACGGLIFYILIYAVWKLSKGRMIGLGDAKLLLSIGTVLGLVYGLSAVFIAVWLGTVYALVLLLKQYLKRGAKHITMKSEIAFGPFLILGFLLVYFLKIDVTSIGFILENY